MKIYNCLNLSNNPRGSFLFLDNNCLIAIISHEEAFGDILEEFSQKGYAFTTIPSVAFEFSRSDTIETHNKRVTFLKKYTSIYPIERHIDEFPDMMLVLQKACGKLSYTDFLLQCCLYKFSDSYLLTENHKDFLTTILDRTGIISPDGGDLAIRNIGLYKFSQEKYQKAAANILQN